MNHVKNFQTANEDFQTDFLTMIYWFVEIQHCVYERLFCDLRRFSDLNYRQSLCKSELLSMSALYILCANRHQSISCTIIH